MGGPAGRDMRGGGLLAVTCGGLLAYEGGPQTLERAEKQSLLLQRGEWPWPVRYWPGETHVTLETSRTATDLCV